jgi:hypothetical protein
MKTPEQKFWDLIKKHLPGEVSRIENSADVGTPDVSGAYNGKDYWIELKICNNKEKIRDVTSLHRNEQLIWHLKRGKQGSIILVMVRYPKFIMIYRWKDGYGMYQPISKNLKGKGFDWEQIKLTIKSEIERRYS